MPINQWESPWDCLQEWDVRAFGEEILDPEEQGRWSRAVFLGGLPWMWHKADVVRELMYQQLEVQPGDRVLLLGESLDPCGFVNDLSERVGLEGSVHAIEIINEARDAYRKGDRGRGGQLATWDYAYTADLPAEHFDCVLVAQGVQHADDWTDAGRELLRVTKPGRRIVLGEISFGPNFNLRAEADVHLEYLVEKLFSRIGWHHTDFPYYPPAELVSAFEGLVEDPNTFAWRGIELFWGRKPMLHAGATPE